MISTSDPHSLVIYMLFSSVENIDTFSKAWLCLDGIISLIDVLLWDGWRVRRSGSEACLFSLYCGVLTAILPTESFVYCYSDVCFILKGFHVFFHVSSHQQGAWMAKAFCSFMSIAERSSVCKHGFHFCCGSRPTSSEWLSVPVPPLAWFVNLFAPQCVDSFANLAASSPRVGTWSKTELLCSRASRNSDLNTHQHIERPTPVHRCLKKEILWACNGPLNSFKGFLVPK